MQTHSFFLPSTLPILTTLLLAFVPPGEPDELAERGAELSSRLAEMVEQAGVPGISIAIASTSGVVWNGAVGERDAASGEKVDEHTVFEAASLSKPVFAYAFLQLVDQGLIELDTPLIEYAPLEDIG